MALSRRSSFFQYVAQTSPDPDGFEVAYGEGIYLYDQKGKRFLDCISGIAVSALGHRHPRILAAIKHQLDLHLHTHVYGEHIIAPQVALAEKLAANLPAVLNTTYFVNSGAEAVEGALKLAKKFTSRYEIVACRNAYHGSTVAGDSLRSDLHQTGSSRPLLPGIRFIDFNDLHDLQFITERTAAVIIEPIQGEAGVTIPHAGYLKAVQNRCRETGALLIFDEIQTGMGRTGYLWAFEHEHVVPDILLLAKAFGGGLPLGAFISRSEIMRSISHHPPLGHMTTFGGNALCCAASLESLMVILQEDLSRKALSHEATIREKLNGHPAIRQIRGRGLMIAVELTESSKLKHAIAACRKESLLVDWFLFNQASIRLAPPLVITEDEVELLCEKLSVALDTL